MAASKYLLGCDVGGTFTDLILIDAQTSALAGRCKTPSTPEDQSIGVENGIKKICADAGISRSQIEVLLHGTTVATNAILEGKGAKVGLITSEGYRQTLHIDRSYVPGGLAGWIIWNKPELLATLENTIECRARQDAFGNEVRPVDEAHLREQLKVLRANGVEAVTVSLLNAYCNGAQEKVVRRVVEEELPGVPVSLSHEVLPEMYEYERALTTVANAAISPKVGQYITNLKAKVGDTNFKILRSDGGLAGSNAASQFPVNLLMSGPAGGVAGAAWVCGQAGYKNLLTLDVGGTSTDVAVVRDGKINTRRETRVGDLNIRAQALDVHTVGAGGGSIAKVPELTKALRVGPESAGARPGPACYGKGGEAPAVSDANCVLGNLPRRGLLGGDFKLDDAAARKAVGAVAGALDLSVEQAAEGIIDIVNENMFGALRVVSVERGFDPREFALVPFGGAGALHGCAIAKLMGSWPVVVPPSPGLLCALGDATTTMKNSKSISFVKPLAKTSSGEVAAALEALGEQARLPLDADNVARADQSVEYEVDMRFKGQGITSLLTIPVTLTRLRAADGTQWLQARLEDEHKRAFTFSFDRDHEVVNLRANVDGKAHGVRAPRIAKGDARPPAGALLDEQNHFYGGKMLRAAVYERSRLLSGNRIEGPAIIVELDSTTLVLAGCVADIDDFGMIVINEAAASAAPARVRDAEPDKITLEVIENALRSARFEMDAVVYRTAMSPGIREQHDQFPIIASPSGDMVVGQFGSFIPGLLRRYTEPINDGDVILLCDPYTCDAAVSHLNDWLVVTPVYYNQTHVGWASMFGHMTDVGGMVACSMPNRAQEIFQEGLAIPPVKLYSKGSLNEDMLKLILHQVRKPDWNHCDLKALLASLELAKIRVQELCKRFGPRTYLRTLDLMLLRNKNAMHEIIKTQVSEDKLYFEDYICDDGQGHGPFKLACTLQKKIQANGEHHAVFDFEGTDPQAASSVNFYMNVELFKMFCGAYMVMVFDPQILFNDGFYPLLDVIIPEGSLLKPKRPAALSCRTHLLGRVFDILGGLLGQRAPQFMCAAGFSDSPHFMYWGDDDGTGERFQYYGIVFGGIPGRPFGDGPDGHSLWPAFTNVPNEFMERYFPLRVEVCESVADSGGAGSFRGGNGVRLVYRFLADGRINIHDDRWWTSPWGVNGGTAAQRSKKTLYRGCAEGSLVSDAAECVASKVDAFPVKKGDTLHYVTWGGGGWGHPHKRDATVVQRDAQRGLVTVDGARRNYGVVLTGPRFDIDEVATKAAREAMERGAEEGQLFDFKWKKGIRATPEEIAQLRARCQEETGFPAPQPHSAPSKELQSVPCGAAQPPATAAPAAPAPPPPAAPPASPAPVAKKVSARTALVRCLQDSDFRDMVMKALLGWAALAAQRAASAEQQRALLQACGSLADARSWLWVGRSFAKQAQLSAATAAVLRGKGDVAGVATVTMLVTFVVQLAVDNYKILAKYRLVGGDAAALQVQSSSLYYWATFFRAVADAARVVQGGGSRLALLASATELLNQHLLRNPSIAAPKWLAPASGVVSAAVSMGLMLAQQRAAAAPAPAARAPAARQWDPPARPEAWKRLQQKRCLVTGSSSGIGKEVALQFAKEGAHVALNYPTGSAAERAKCEDVAAEIRALGRRAIVCAADVSKEDEVAAMVARVVAEFGHIDVLVNNAGIASGSTIEDMPTQMWDDMMRINLKGVFLCTRAVLPLMYKHQEAHEGWHGKIINTASQLAYKGAPGFSHYTATKGAILSFTRSATLEIGKRRVRINCVAPGATMTPILAGVPQDVLDAIVAQIPTGKMGQVDVIAPAYVYLASDESNHTAGQCLSPNGGDVFL